MNVFRTVICGLLCALMVSGCPNRNDEKVRQAFSVNTEKAKLTLNNTDKFIHSFLVEPDYVVDVVNSVFLNVSNRIPLSAHDACRIDHDRLDINPKLYKKIPFKGKVAGSGAAYVPNNDGETPLPIIYQLEAFDEGAGTISGRLYHCVQEFDLMQGKGLSDKIRYENIEITNKHKRSMNGEFFYQMDLNTKQREYRWNLAVYNQTTDESVRFEEFHFTSRSGSGISFKGRIYYDDEGYIELKSENPLHYSHPPSAPDFGLSRKALILDMGGPVRFFGSENTLLKLFYPKAGELVLLIDENGDQQYDLSGSARLQGDGFSASVFSPFDI